MADYESVLCLKNEVFVYKIPARASNRGYRAADWKLDEPDWTGRLKVTAKGRDLNIKLEDKTTGELFAQCPVDGYPTSAVEQVLDSSRYFVVRIQDGSGRNAFIGIGFADRGDSFDLLVAIQDHFKHVKREEMVTEHQGPDGATAIDLGPKLDLSFKEGQTIKLNFATKKAGEPGVAKARPKGGVGASPFLPPPPGGVKIAAPLKGLPPSQQHPSLLQSAPPTFNVNTGTPVHATATPSQTAGSSNVDLLLDIGQATGASKASSKPTPAAVSESDIWDDFSSISVKSQPPAPPSQAPSSTSALSWVNFD